MQDTHRFIEETILHVFLWIGLWGSISIFIDHYLLQFETKLLFYILVVMGSFYLLKLRNHI